MKLGMWFSHRTFTNIPSSPECFLRATCTLVSAAVLLVFNPFLWAASNVLWTHLCLAGTRVSYSSLARIDWSFHLIITLESRGQGNRARGEGGRTERELPTLSLLRFS
jgi:hypothetical protein